MQEILLFPVKKQKVFIAGNIIQVFFTQQYFPAEVIVECILDEQPDLHDLFFRQCDLFIDGRCQAVVPEFIPLVFVFVLQYPQVDKLVDIFLHGTGSGFFPQGPYKFQCFLPGDLFFCTSGRNKGFQEGEGRFRAVHF